MPRITVHTRTVRMRPAKNRIKRVKMQYTLLLIGFLFFNFTRFTMFYKRTHRRQSRPRSTAGNWINALDGRWPTFIRRLCVSENIVYRKRVLRVNAAFRRDRRGRIRATQRRVVFQTVGWSFGVKKHSAVEFTPWGRFRFLFILFPQTRLSFRFRSPTLFVVRIFFSFYLSPNLVPSPTQRGFCHPRSSLGHFENFRISNSPKLINGRITAGLLRPRESCRRRRRHRRRREWKVHRPGRAVAGG